jgi:hypothetical protein
MKWKWTGFNVAGKANEGHLEANSMEDAAGKLRTQGIFVSKLIPEEAPAPAPAPAPTPAEAPAPAPPEAPPAPDPKADQPWVSRLEAQLKVISEICNLVQQSGVPDAVVADAA